MGIIKYDAFIFGTYMNKILDKLINSTADEWNSRVAMSIGVPVSSLRDMVISRELRIAESKINLYIDKHLIDDIAKDQLTEDADTKVKLLNADNESAYNPTIIDKFIIKVKSAEDNIVESIALTGKILVGVDFSESDLSNSYFCGCVFYNCSFKNCSLESSVITGCVFNTCDFTECDLTGSTIARTQIYESTLINSVFEYCSISDSALLSNVFDSSTFIQSKILFTGISDSSLIKCDFKDTDIVQCSLVNSDFSSGDFKRSTLVDSILVRSNFSSCDLASLMVTCITQVKCLYDSKYESLFAMDLLLYSPALFEWESEETSEPEPDNRWE